MEENKKVEEIEVHEPEVVKAKVSKSKRVKTVIKHRFLEDLGTDESGEIRYKKGQDYELTKKQIDNYKKHNLICQI